MSEHPAGMQVLIVDDDPIMGELLDALLTAEGFCVTRALSGEEALEVAHSGQHRPDVILCDLQMPGMQGGELGTALAAARTSGTLPGKTVLLAMSGSAPRADEARWFAGFLRKPFSVADFGRAVEQARDRRAQMPATAPADPEVMVSSRRPPLDEKIFEQLRSKIGGESLRQLYDMTLDDVRERVGRIRDASASGDESTVRKEAHTIKGSCGMVGALELQVLAAATEGGSPVDTSALADFDSACERLERMLNEKL